MKIKIETRKKNVFFNREDLGGKISHTNEATPSKAAVQLMLAKELKVKPEHVEVCQIMTMFGKHVSKLIARVWKEKKFPILANEKKKVEKKEEKKE